MAGAGLIAIKRRIKSVISTKKITKAMGLVATAKLRRTRNRLALSERYHSSYKEAMDEIIKNYPADATNILTNGNEVDKKLFILITSDSGFCGGYNANLVNGSIKDIKDKPDSSIILVGVKGRSYLRRNKIDSFDEYDGISDIPTLKEAKKLAEYVLKLFLDGKTGEINIVYTHFVSTIKQDVEIKKLLPLGYNADGNIVPYVEFEPDIKDILKETAETYLCEEIYNCILSARACEQASRMTAMDGATKNADDILEKLKLQYSQRRQSAITQEITEIIGGAGAQE